MRAGFLFRSSRIFLGFLWIGSGAVSIDEAEMNEMIGRSELFNHDRWHSLSVILYLRLYRAGAEICRTCIRTEYIQYLHITVQTPRLTST